jgi:leader peptidase (prepilin peptidase) / N-methyltransferase
MILIIIFISGLIIGSFLNVVIYRLPVGESIILPASHCPYCKTPLKIYDLIPVISYLSTGGKCRYCGHKISWQYPFVEILTAILFLFFYLYYGIKCEFIIFLILISLLIVSSFIDIRYQIIPNKITYSGIIIGLLMSVFFKHISFISSILGMIIPAAFLLFISSFFKKGLGMGDVKLVAMIGTFISYKYTLIGIFIGSLSGSIIALILMGFGLIDRKSRIPFGPFISFGTILMLLFGKKLIDFYFKIFV